MGWISGATENMGHGDPKSLGSWGSPGAQRLDLQGLQGEGVGVLGSRGLVGGPGKGDSSRYYLSWPWGPRLWEANGRGGALAVQLTGAAVVTA